MSQHDHSKYVTKDDLKEAFTVFETHITNQHEKRIQMISGHYSDILKATQDTHQCLQNLEKKIEPLIETQQVVTGIGRFFGWLGIPKVAAFGAIGAAFYWMWKNLTS